MTAAEFRAWRKGLGWSQQRAADELGVSLRTIGNYEFDPGVVSENDPSPCQWQLPKMVALATKAISFREYGIVIMRGGNDG